MENKCNGKCKPTFMKYDMECPIHGWLDETSLSVQSSDEASSGGEGNFYEAVYEDIMEGLKKYCVAQANVEIRKDDNGYFFDCNLKDSVYILSGFFPEESVVEAFQDFDFDGIDKEGCWQIKVLLSHSPAQYGDEGRVEVQDYLLIEYKELIYQCSFEEKEKQEKELSKCDLFGNKTETVSPYPLQGSGQVKLDLEEIDDTNFKYPTYQQAGGNKKWDDMTELEKANYDNCKYLNALAVSKNTIKRLRNKIYQLEASSGQSYPRWVKYKTIAELISSIFFYGKFKPETKNERDLEQLLIEVDLWPTTEDEIIKRKEETQSIQEGEELPNLEKSTANLSQIKDKDKWLNELRGEGEN